MKRYLCSLLLCSCLLVGCVDRELERFSYIGASATITVYGGETVKIYHSRGPVSFKENGAVVYFVDVDTKQSVIVSGTFTVESGR